MRAIPKNYGWRYRFPMSDSIHYPPAVSDSVKFGRTADDYAKYRVGFPSLFFEELAALGAAKRGTRALDIGTGTGTVARGLAKLGCEVDGVDPAETLWRQAEALDREAGVQVHYHTGTAEALPFPAATFGLVTAGQCWHWFRPAEAAAEIRRVLAPRGTLVICYFDWVTTDGSITDLTERLIAAENPEWTPLNKPQFFRRQTPEVPTPVGFEAADTVEFTVPVRYTHEAWRGRIRASAPIGASLPPDRIEQFDRKHAEQLRAHFPAEPLVIPHRVWAQLFRKA